MKKFTDICGYDKVELKKYLKNYMRTIGYTPIDEDGFLLCKPKEKNNMVPVMLVAHMDTVHREKIKTIESVPYTFVDRIETRISSPEGIGGDDRCGIWALMKLAKQFNCYILFTEDEEVGGVGAKKFVKTKYCNEIAKEIKYMIEIDRRGKDDAVFYSCDNKEFTKWIEDNTSFKSATGSYTDIETLMPEMGIAGVNFSSGYYGAHTLNEYVVLEELDEIIDRIADLLSLEIPKKFEYVKKTYTSYYGNYLRGYYEDDDDYYWSEYYKNRFNNQTKKVESTKPKYEAPKKTKRVVSDTTITLIAYLETDYAMDYEYGDVLMATANTKPECWMNLFMNYPEISFEMIEDYDYE